MTMQTMNRLFSVCAAALLLLTACHAPALEELTPPDTQEPEIVPERTTIPYSLKVGTESTRVAYDPNQNAYDFKEEDKLQVKGLGNRTDIEGELTQNGTDWSGTISYLTSKGDPAEDNPQLEIMLIHADNTDTTTYAKTLVGSAPQGTSLLKSAIERYSLFKTTVAFNEHEGTLLQQAAFMQFAITFKFDGTHEVGQGGDAKVDLQTSRFEAFADVPFVRESPDSHNYTVSFVAVVPGGQSLSDFTLTVADREITFNNTNTTLARNTQYTVTREITYGPQLGDPFWSDGTYGRMNHPEGSAQIVGIIVYVNHGYSDPDKRAIDDAITEASSGFGHGLVMALKNVTWNGQNRFIWSGTTGNIQCTAGFIQTPNQTMYSPYFSGLENTDKIIEKLGNGCDSAASLAKQYGDKPGSSSGWFLPSIGQWMYTISIDGFGNADHAYEWINGNGQNWLENGNVTGDLVYVKKCEDGSVNVLVKALNERLAKLQRDFSDYHFEYDSFGDPSGEANVSDNYWTSTEKTEKQAIRMNLGTVEKWKGIYYSTIKAKGESKQTLTPYGTYQMKVRPFLAF